MNVAYLEMVVNRTYNHIYRFVSMEVNERTTLEL